MSEALGITSWIACRPLWMGILDDKCAGLFLIDRAIASQGDDLELSFDPYFGTAPFDCEMRVHNCDSEPDPLMVRLRGDDAPAFPNALYVAVEGIEPPESGRFPDLYYRVTLQMNAA